MDGQMRGGGIMEIINVAFSVRQKGCEWQRNRDKTRRVYKTLTAREKLRSLTGSLFVQWEQRQDSSGHRSPVPWWVRLGGVIGTLAC